MSHEPLPKGGLMHLRDTLNLTPTDGLIKKKTKLFFI